MPPSDEEEGPPTHREGRGAQYRRETEAFLVESLAPPKNQRRRLSVLPFIVGFAIGAALCWLVLLAARLSN